MKYILSWLTVKLPCSPLSCLFRFLARLLKCSICVPVSAISGVVMEMWHWSVILQGTCTLLVWLFVLLLGSITYHCSLICPPGSLLSEWAKSLHGNVSTVDHAGSRVLPEMLNTLPTPALALLPRVFSDTIAAGPEFLHTLLPPSCGI